MKTALIIVGFVVFALLLTFSLCKVASDYDDAMERWNEEHLPNQIIQ